MIKIIELTLPIVLLTAICSAIAYGECRTEVVNVETNEIITGLDQTPVDFSTFPRNNLAVRLSNVGEENALSGTIKCRDHWVIINNQSETPVVATEQVVDPNYVANSEDRQRITSRLPPNHTLNLVRTSEDDNAQSYLGCVEAVLQRGRSDLSVYEDCSQGDPPGYCASVYDEELGITSDFLVENLPVIRRGIKMVEEHLQAAMTAIKTLFPVP